MNRTGQATGPHSEEHASGAAENCEQHTFGEHLTNEPRASGNLQSGANGHFALACSEPRASRMFSTFMQASNKTKAARTRNRPETTTKKLFAYGMGRADFSWGLRAR